MTLTFSKVKSADFAFLGFIAVWLAAFWKPLAALVSFSLTHNYCSHAILIPFICAFLLFFTRPSIRRDPRSWLYGILLAIPAVPVFLWAVARKSDLGPDNFIVATTFSIICVWISGFAVCYGLRAFRTAIFPLCLLFLMIPLPTAAVQAFTRFLQQGSTEITWWLLQAVGQPSVKSGFTIYLPKLTILVAEECSGIRSSLALFVTCLLAGHMMLRSNWRRAVFVLLSFPVALIKNGIRIDDIE